MAMNVASSSAGGGRRGRRKPVMAEINVTPMVDVMLVLLIIFMVSAPLLTVGVPLDLPQTQAKSLDQDKNPLTLSVNLKGQVFLNDTEIGLDDLLAAPIEPILPYRQVHAGRGSRWRALHQLSPLPWLQ